MYAEFPSEFTNLGVVKEFEETINWNEILITGQ